MKSPIFTKILNTHKQIATLKASVFDILLNVIPPTLTEESEINKLRDYCIWHLYKQGMSYASISNVMSKSTIHPKQGGDWTRYVVKSTVNRLKKGKTK